MQSAYQTLHEQGLAHAISCYLGQELVGGLYGVGGVLILRGIHVLPRVKRVKNCFRFLDEGL